MAHFAELDSANQVTRVIVVNNSIGDESQGVEFCKSLFGADTHWVQTSYNSSFRKHYAGIGFTYDAVSDAFIPPKPFDSWSLDQDCNWQPPVEYPADGNLYTWSETDQTWIFMMAAEVTDQVAPGMVTVPEESETDPDQNL
jgi:hypothetical protein